MGLVLAQFFFLDGIDVRDEARYRTSLRCILAPGSGYTLKPRFKSVSFLLNF
jgi:hypothetical protein